MPDDIVERLRNAYHEAIPTVSGRTGTTFTFQRESVIPPDLLREAATEIERLRKDNLKLQLLIQDGWKRIEELETEIERLQKENEQLGAALDHWADNY